jgi:PAS domain S-box-containing protein
MSSGVHHDMVGVRLFRKRGSVRRVGPFALVAVAVLVIAALPPRVGPPYFALAVVFTVAILVAAVVLPWDRWGPDWWAVPPIAYLTVVALLRQGTEGGSGTTYLGLGLLPVLWLAMRHRAALLCVGLVGLSIVALLPPVLGGIDRYPPAELRRALLIIGGCVVISVGVKLSFDRSRRDAERLLTLTREARRDQDFISAVLDTAGFLVVVVDLQGRISLFNRACEQITGYSADAVIGRPYWEVVPGVGDPQAYVQAFAALRREDFPRSSESDWLSATAGRRRISWRNTVMTDEQGRVTHVINTGIDVTDQRRAEQLFSNVLAAATEQAIIGAQLDGTITVFNVGAERLLGYAAADVIGVLNMTAMHVPAELAERAAEMDGAVGSDVLFRCAQAGESETREWTYLRKDGSAVPVVLTVSAMRDEFGEVAGYLGIARDVTGERQAVEMVHEAYQRERQAAARLRALDRTRSDLVGTVSHELRTPLTSILGNVELLTDGDAGPVTEPQAQRLAAVERNARRLLALIEDLLMLSRIESGAVKINAQAFSLCATVNAALQTLAATAARRGVTIETEMPTEPVLVHGDRDQIERIVINLVDNALKFTPPGGTACVRVDGGEAQVRLTITDTGMGIPPEEINHIFERFFRSSLSQERASQGSGLGLAITKSIVDRHGGRIWVHSQPGNGTEVVCLLPTPPPEPFVGGSRSDRDAARSTDAVARA